jgi:hypothetical protein
MDEYDPREYIGRATGQLPMDVGSTCGTGILPVGLVASASCR